MASACATSHKKVRSALVSEPATLHYLLETPRVEKSPYKKIFLSVTPALVEEDTTILEKTRFYVIPLLIYNQSMRTDHYAISANGIKENLTDFLREGFLRQAERDCEYVFTSSKDSADYLLNLGIENFNGETNINSYGHNFIFPFFPLLTITWRNALNYNINSSVKLNYQVTDIQGETIVDDAVMHHDSLANISLLNINIPKVKDYTAANASVTEGLSICFQNCFEQIIKELNEI